eukprot:1183631-Prorocentrum_minimum.AAC.3
MHMHALRGSSTNISPAFTSAIEWFPQAIIYHQPGRNCKDLMPPRKRQIRNARSACEHNRPRDIVPRTSSSKNAMSIFGDLIFCASLQAAKASRSFEFDWAVAVDASDVLAACFRTVDLDCT